jgi:hypothetical protein
MAFDPTQPFEVVEDPQAQAGGAPRFDPSQAFEVVDDGQTSLIEGGVKAVKRGLDDKQIASARWSSQRQIRQDHRDSAARSPRTRRLLSLRR